MILCLADVNVIHVLLILQTILVIILYTGGYVQIWMDVCDNTVCTMYHGYQLFSHTLFNIVFHIGVLTIFENIFTI